jgi:hypothetical protein
MNPEPPIDFDRHDFTPAKGIADIPGLTEKLEAVGSRYRKAVLRQSQARQEESPMAPNPNERTFLDHLSLGEFEPVHRLFGRMGNPAPATQKRILEGLERKGLITSAVVHTARAIRIAYPTAAGWQHLNKKSRFSPLRGGMVHTFVCRWKQALDLKRGCEESTCECQYPNSSGIGDVCTKISGKLHFTEVVIDCNSNINKHLRSCFLDSDQVESLTIVTLLKSEHATIRTTILADPELVFCIGRISFVTVDQILKELYSDESR